MLGKWNLYFSSIILLPLNHSAMASLPTWLVHKIQESN